MIVESIKKAEYSDNLILRLYETSGMDAQLQLKSNEKIKEVWITNLVEKEQEKLVIKNDTIQLNFKPFEIHTIKITIDT